MLANISKVLVTFKKLGFCMMLLRGLGRKLIDYKY